MAGVPIVDEAVKKVTESMVDRAFGELKKQYDYIFHYKEMINEAKDAHKKLELGIRNVEKQATIGKRKLARMDTMVDVELKKAEEVRGRNEWNELNDCEMSANCKCCFGSLFCNPFNRYQLSKKAAKLSKDVLKQMEEGIGKFVLNQVTHEEGPPKLSSGPTFNYKSLPSRERVVNKICEVLEDKDGPVIGLHGMGGAGKTTLINEVARRLEDAFQAVVVVEVSQAPNMKLIQDRIAERIRLPLHDVHSLEERALKLHKGLQAKGEGDKKLVILDNVWEKLDLDKVGIPKSFKILVTTRERSVCKMMGATDANIFEVGILGNNEAKELFSERVGDVIKTDAEYESVVNDLLDSCSRLPLAIVVLGDMLKNQSYVSWRSVATNLGKLSQSNVSGVHGHLYSVFELSYNFINNDGKKLFLLLCCLFPHGLPIKIEDLMRYGIGMGLFQHVNSLIEAIELAHSWVDQLQSGSWLLRDEERKDIWFDKLENKFWFGIIIDESSLKHMMPFVGSYDIVKIHDVVRAIVIPLAAKGDEHVCQVGSFPRWLMKETYRTYTAISMTKDDSHELLGIFPFPKLQILLLNGSKPSTFPDTFFQEMVQLRVLVLKDMDFSTSLPSSMAVLTSLRTLHLEKCKLGNVTVLGELSELVVLSLRGSNINELPNEISRLHGLIMLDLTECHLKNISPNIIAQLTSLEGLYMFQSFKNWGSENSNQASLAELKCLPFLCHLEVEVPTIEDWPHGLQVDNLVSYKINIGSFMLETYKEFSRQLCLQGTDVTKRTLGPLRQGLANLLKKSEFLQLKDISRLKNIYDLDKDGLIELKVLLVVRCNELEYIINTAHLSSTISFPKLRTLYLYQLKRMKEIARGHSPPDFFFHLQDVILQDLPELQHVWSCCNNDKQEKNTGGKVVMHSLKYLVLNDLPSLKSFWCSNARPHTSSDSESRLPLFTDQIEFPSLEILRVEDVQHIEELWHLVADNCEGSPSKPFSQLRQLRLTDLPKLRHVWTQKLAERSRSFHNLKELELDGCTTLESLCPLSVSVLLPLLEQMRISSCHNMEYLFYSCPSMSFPVLKTLHISQCEKMETIIKMAPGKGSRGKDATNPTASFPSLHTLDLCVLSKLVSIIFGARVLEWRSLERLKIYWCPNFKTITLASKNLAQESGIVTTVQPLFKQEDVLPSIRFMEFRALDALEAIWDKQPVPESFCHLEKLDVIQCHRLVTVVPVSVLPRMHNLTSVTVVHDDMVEQQFKREGELIMIPRLRYLDLYELPKLEEQIKYWSMFPSLRVLCVTKLCHQTLISSSRDVPHLQHLESLRVEDCESMEVLVDLEGIQGSSTNSLPVIHNFNDLSLISLPKLKCVPWLMFKGLRTLTISEISGWQSLFSTSIATYLDQLEYIIVRTCAQMKELVTEDGDEVIAEEDSVNYVFPRLKHLELGGLPCLRSFSQWKYAVEFPSLEVLCISGCENMQSFSTGPVAAPLLRHLTLDRTPLHVEDGLNVTIQQVYENKQKAKQA